MFARMNPKEVLEHIASLTDDVQLTLWDLDEAISGAKELFGAEDEEVNCFDRMTPAEREALQKVLQKS